MTRRRINRRGRRPRARNQEGTPVHVIPTVGPTIPVEAEAQRARFGGTSADSRSGTGLGQLANAGRITEAQYEAGRRAEAIWSEWQRLAQCPAPVQRQRTPGSASEPDADAWGRAKRRFEEMRAAMRRVRASKLAWIVLHDVTVGCLDFRDSPVAWERWPVWGPALRDALDALANEWKIGERRAA
jgi:hypothetical protein